MHDELSAELEVGTRVVPSEEHHEEPSGQASIDYRIRMLASEIGRIEEDDEEWSYEIQEVPLDLFEPDDS